MRREGLLDYLGYERQRTWKRESCIKYAAVQMRLPRGGITQSHFLPLFQPVNHPHAMAASRLLLWHFPLLMSDIFSWPFLCCLGSFKYPSLTRHSARSCWESVSFWLSAAAMSPFCHSPRGPHAGKKRQLSPRTNGQVHRSVSQPEGLCLWELPQQNHFPFSLLYAHLCHTLTQDRSISQNPPLFIWVCVLFPGWLVGSHV